MKTKVLLAAAILVAAAILWDASRPVPAIVPRTMMDGARFLSRGDTAILDYSALDHDSITADTIAGEWQGVPAWRVEYRVWRGDSLLRLDPVWVRR